MFHLAQGLARGVHDPLSKGRRRQAMHKLAVEGTTCQISPKCPADGEGCRPTKMAEGAVQARYLRSCWLRKDGHCCSAATAVPDR
jgi:hypothetical protein